MLRWKHKYWYWLVFSVFAPSIAITVAVLAMKDDSHSTAQWATLAATAPTFLSSFFVYIYRSFKENYPCRDLIKPSRMKYFYSGLSSTFFLFSSYLVFWLLAWKQQNWAWYVGLALTMICGLVSLVYFSLYEFCISFDVFYSNNKKELVHDFLEKVSGKKLKIIPD